MTAQDIYNRVIRKGRVSEAGYPFETKFLLDLEEALNLVSLKALGLSTGSKVTGKEHCIRTYTNIPPGHIGYQGKYKMPTDLIRVTRMEINLDGKCWKEPNFVNYSDFTCSLHKDGCNSCEACFSECKPDVVINNKEIHILSPIQVASPCGVKLWYLPRYTKITEKEQDIDIDDIAIDYLIYTIILMIQQIDSDKYSTTNNNRLYSLYKKAEEAFSYYYQGDKLVKRIRFKTYGLY